MIFRKRELTLIDHSNQTYSPVAADNCPHEHTFDSDYQPLERQYHVKSNSWFLPKSREQKECLKFNTNIDEAHLSRIDLGFRIRKPRK